MRTRTLPRLRLSHKASIAVLALLGLALLVVPTSSCGPAVTAWTADPLAAPKETPPQLDDAEVARDADAVRAAQVALAAWRPAATAPAPAPSSTTRTSTVSAVSASEVAAAQQRLDAAERDVDADQSDLDRLLQEQESSSDPAQYDDQVAAAREELDRSVAVRDEAARDLRTAKSRTKTVTVTTTASPRTSVTTRPAGDRAELAAALADARTQQTADLSARSKAVAAWRTGYQEAARRVAAHNARLRACASRAAVPGSTGLVLLLAAAAVAAAHTVRARLTH